MHHHERIIMALAAPKSYGEMKSGERKYENGERRRIINQWRKQCQQRA